MLEPLVHSHTADGFGTWNTLGLADPELDRLIEESSRAATDAERASRLQAAMARLGELRALGSPGPGAHRTAQADAVRVGWFQMPGPLL